MAGRPIGVFDSGVGGLTVLRELRRGLPHESTLYFGDTARVPYGSKSAATVRQYVREAAAFLLSRDVKLIVVACNTAAAHALEVLAGELPVPVVGVIEPGARAAVRATQRGRIGVLGTAGTIGSGAYDRAVRRLRADARVYGQPCPLFVPLVEEGWAEHAATRLIAREYLAPLRAADVDAVIMGCTHYPLLLPVLAAELGSGITLVDAGAETALEVRERLCHAGLLRQAVSAPEHRYVVSDSPARFAQVAARLLDEQIGNVERLDVEGYDEAA